MTENSIEESYKSKYEDAGFMTKSVHVGRLRGDQFGALTTPIYQTSTYRFKNAAQGARRFSGEEGGFIYSRNRNPTLSALEDKVANLEGGAGAIACASGMGAIASIVWTLLKSGDHIIVGDCLYGCSDVLIRQTMPKFGVEVSAVDTSNIEALKAAIRPNTKIIFFETPTNPLMKITDIAAVKQVAGNDILVVVDNTFAPPPIQYPFKHGADIVVHSATKYLNGHGDVIGGLIVSTHEDLLIELRKFGMSKLTGSVLSPHDAYLIIRGIQTLGLRVERHCENALVIAKYLEQKEEVARVHYPGLPGSQGADLVKTQMNGYGTGIMSFELKPEVRGKSGVVSGAEAAITVLDNMRVAHLAVSLGDPFSLIEHPFSMTHSVIPEDVNRASGITPELIRFSAGLEDPQDLIADFEQAFAKI